MKRSLRASSSRPTTCSGDMYPSLPLSCPASVRRSISAARAMPKSVSFTAPRAVDEHVAGRHVAVHERERAALVVARAVRVLERAEDGEDDVEADVERDVLAARRGGADEARAGRPVDVLHRHVELAVLLAEVEHLDDVRVAEARADARLVDEHGDEVRVARELREDALDGDDLLEAVRAAAAREIHLRHPARRDPPEQLVRPQAQRRRDAGDRHRFGKLNIGTICLAGSREAARLLWLPARAARLRSPTRMSSIVRVRDGSSPPREREAALASR